MLTPKMSTMAQFYQTLKTKCY